MTERIADRDTDAILAEYEELTLELHVPPAEAAKRAGSTLHDISNMYLARKRRQRRQQARLERTAAYDEDDD